ncbi:MAG: DUF937 domain-containing protein [Verrucomicrobiota bacterium]
MATLVEEVVEELNPQVAPLLEQRLSVDGTKASQVLPLVTPLVVSGMKKLMQGGGGLGALTSLLDSEADETELDDLPAAVERRSQAAGSSSLLDSLLGSANEPAIDALKTNLGLERDQASQALSIVGPLVLSFLSKKRSGSEGTNGLASLLDRDGDGDLLDDVGGMLLNHISSKHTGSQGSTGGIGGLLGSLLK